MIYYSYISNIWYNIDIFRNQKRYWAFKLIWINQYFSSTESRLLNEGFLRRFEKSLIVIENAPWIYDVQPSKLYSLWDLTSSLCSTDGPWNVFLCIFTRLNDCIIYIYYSTWSVPKIVEIFATWKYPGNCYY